MRLPSAARFPLLLLALVASVWWLHAARADESIAAPPGMPATSGPKPGLTSVQPAAPSLQAPKEAHEPAPDQHRPAQLPPTFHASPVQRASDLRRLRDDPDLLGLALELAARTNSGDRDAMRALAKLLNRCIYASNYDPDGDPRTWEYTVVSADLEATAAAQLQALARIEIGRCRDLRGSDEASVREIAGAFTRAVNSDDNWATAMVPLFPGQTPESMRERRRRALQNLLAEGDPALLWQQSDLLGAFGDRFGGSFLMAACALDPSCARDPRGYGLRLLLEGGDYQQGMLFLQLRMLSPRDFQIAEFESGAILRLWGERRYAELVGSPPRPGRP